MIEGKPLCSEPSKSLGSGVQFGKHCSDWSAHPRLSQWVPKSVSEHSGRRVNTLRQPWVRPLPSFGSCGPLPPSVAQKSKRCLKTSLCMAHIGGQFRRNGRAPSKAWMAKRKVFPFHLERVAGGEVGGEFGQPTLDVAFTPLLIGCFPLC